YDSKTGLIEIIERWRAGKRGPREREVGERRTVIFTRIILVVSLLVQITEFDRVDRFIVVHWPAAQVRPSQRERHGQRRNDPETFQPRMHKEFGAAGSQEKERGIRAVSSDAKND